MRCPTKTKVGTVLILSVPTFYAERNYYAYTVIMAACCLYLVRYISRRGTKTRWIEVVRRDMVLVWHKQGSRVLILLEFH